MSLQASSGTKCTKCMPDKGLEIRQVNLYATNWAQQNANWQVQDGGTQDVYVLSVGGIGRICVIGFMDTRESRCTRTGNQRPP
ncbi:hypothetical protein PILCRDRAFT_818766 [Piloderma croceum F 1598]|uniref:Uncharacterized protein n=1 Tax=Piloderma croceum (strain F 1598) TaxID=765440 RepID=A0A0C3C443_PILCF|nr:hypothetical protein PILCRDRAFT_818766 [Piloderma croceum F 1598]